MGLCAPRCSRLPAQPTQTGCRIEVRQGGLSRLIFADCSLQFEDITSLTEWAEYVATGRIVVTQELVGQMPKASFTKKRLSSCSPEAVIGVERTITFLDNNADDDGFTDYDFWNDIQANYSQYQFGYMSCDGRFYGLIANFTPEVAEVIEDNNTGNAFWDGSIMFNEFDQPKPYFIQGLLPVLLGNFANTGFDLCAAIQASVISGLQTELCLEGGISLSVPFYLGTSYQWYKDAIPIDGAIYNTYVADEAGDYTCAITNATCSPVTFTTAAYTITSIRPEITSVVEAPAGTVTITVTGGPAGFLYQLVLNGVTPTAWQLDNNVFTSVPSGTHTVKVRNSTTQCTALSEVVVA